MADVTPTNAMLSVEEARERVLARFQPLAVEEVPLVEALGRVLAEDAIARESSPPFANSAMDGYALRSADTRAATPEAPVHLRLAGEVPAGSVYAGDVGPGEAVRILTGAPVPAGADAVIGGHPHVTQGAEIYHGKPIIYSFGNFVFDGFHEDATRTGWLVRLTVNKRGVVHWDTLVAKLDDEGSPQPDLMAQSPCGSGHEIFSCRAGQH